MRMRKLGALEVSELGFGTLSFASTYGLSPERAESVRVIRGAHDVGVTLFDTARPTVLDQRNPARGSACARPQRSRDRHQVRL